MRVTITLSKTSTVRIDNAITIPVPLENTGVGSCSLGANTTGAQNTATGSSALQINTTGSYNVAIGTGALSLANGDDVDG